MSSGASTTRESLANQRAAPVVLFLDRSFEPRTWSAYGEELWERYGATIVSLLRTLGELDHEEHVTTFTPERDHTVRVARLTDDAGYVVILDPMRARDPLAHCVERYSLTPRECDVLRLLVEGANTDEIADRLSIARSTVVIHLKSIMSKTGTRSRVAAVGRMLHPDGDATPGI